MAIRICIVGAGAIGGWLGALLGHRLGAELRLSALARGRTLEALRAQGLRMDIGGERLVVPVHASSDPGDLGPQDLVVVAVKGPALASVAPVVHAMLGPQTKVLVAMNGVPWWFFDGLSGEADGLRLESVDPGGRIAELIPTERVIGCVVHASCATPEPGLVRHVMGNGLIIGAPSGGQPDHVAELVALLQRAGFEATLSQRIQRDIWFKLWGNMTTNPISALTGATTDRIMADELLVRFTTSIMREAAVIGERIGCKVDQQPEDRHAITRRLGEFKTSMLQDAEAGRPLELDALLGAVREVAQHLRMDTPFLDALLGMARLMARTRGLA